MARQDVIQFPTILLDKFSRTLYNTHMETKKGKAIYLITRSSDADRAACIKAAERAGMNLSEWLRRVVKLALRREKRAA